MKKYNLINNTLGWLVFVVAAVTYLLTIEPTASFWDCPEFIAQGFKSEIGHPPGNPIFILTARFFTLFAGGDVTAVAKCVNAMSALFSAATILLLFWTITHLVKKLVVNDGDEDKMTLAQYLVVMGSGVAGALAYTWSDTFWFSAVEAEVYAFSSFCTALVFWLILKWESRADEPGSDRWLILIAYIFGVSLGVHLLNLLCIPAIALVFYYRKYKNTSAKGSIITLLISFAIIVAILYGLEPGFVEMGQKFDLFAVNTLGMSFNTGVIIYAFVLIAALAWNIWEVYQGTNDLRIKISFTLAIVLSGILLLGDSWWLPILLFIGLCVYLFKYCKAVPRRIMANISLSILVIFIGFASYGVILIRSNANTPLDENSPNNTFALAKYLSREQYGETPLLYGRTVFSQVVYQEQANGTMKPMINEGPMQYAEEVKQNPNDPDHYKELGYKKNYVFAPEQNMVFPRIHSEAHAQQYQDWLGMEGTTVEATTRLDRDGNASAGKEQAIKPTVLENIRFFIDYQLNYMYWRYFMWNFAGRQNDIQGMGEITQGNWISGIPFIDNPRLGDQSLLPDDLGKGNKGHNVFYLLPLLLGIIGLLWQAYRGKRGIEQFWVVFFLFFMTGIAIVLYLNQTPSQPRERDYAYAGSFYAYAIWCGIGVAAIITMLTKWLDKKLKAQHLRTALAAVVSLLCLIVPIQMASQTWDDHDRSGRYTCRDFGQNYLMTLQQEGNPIIFTNGDNDTFPLWYNMDTEGVRTDARVCNLSYLATDWYIDQMVRPAYDSPSLPITWPRLKYVSGTNDLVQIVPDMKQEVLSYYEQHPDEARQNFGDDPFELRNIMKYWVLSDNPDLHFIPTDTVHINIDADAVRRSGMMIQGDSIPERMDFSLKGMRSLDKSKLMMLEMLANANWERPIYVAMTVGSDNLMSLDNHFVQEGLAYRITPYNTRQQGFSNFDTEKTYDNVMHRFKFGGVNTPGIYLDETVMRMCLTHKMLMVELAEHLFDEGQHDKALEVLTKMDRELPPANVPHDLDCRKIEGRYMGYQDGKQAFYVTGSSFREAMLYAELGQPEKATPILDYFWQRANQYLDYYNSLSGNAFIQEHESCLMQLAQMNRIIQAYYSIDEEKAEKLFDDLQKRCQQLQGRGVSLDAVHWV